MSKTSFAHGQLKAFVERIERLEEEKAAIAADVKEVYAEAKGTGFDTTILRKVIALRKKDAAERQEEEAMLDVYLAALGMQPSLFEEEESRPQRQPPVVTGQAEEGAPPRAVSSSADQLPHQHTPMGQHGGPTDETADAELEGVSTYTAKSAEAVQPIQEPPPESVPASAAQGAEVIGPVEASAPHPSHEMPEMPGFLDRRKHTAADYLAAG
jgi:uncharacterized protein (UPF0335 family)